MYIKETVGGGGGGLMVEEKKTVCCLGWIEKVKHKRQKKNQPADCIIIKIKLFNYEFHPEIISFTLICHNLIILFYEN